MLVDKAIRSDVPISARPAARGPRIMALAIIAGAVAIALHAAPAQQCAECHRQSIKAASAKAVVHAPFKDEAKCGTCHAPHDPGGKKAMREPEPQLCTSCHTGARYKLAHRTSLADRGLCTPCHSGHASQNPALMKFAEAELCARCHKGVNVSHKGYGVNTARCTICHPVHGETSSKRLRAVIHPVASDCSSCHRQAGAQDQFQRTKEPPELCFGCHPNVQEALRQPVVHPAVADAGCLACHAAHSSDENKLLNGPETKLCLECHPTIEEKLKAKKVHEPVRKGECHACHSPHAAAQKKLLARAGGKLCQGCHAQVVGWPGARSIHGPVRSGQCNLCHDAHGAGPKLLANDGAKPCAACHSPIHARMKKPGAVVHPPAADGCMGCHLPHVSEQARLLKTAPPALCVECHDASGVELVKKHGGYSIASSNCAGCHDPHVAGSAGLIRDEKHMPFTDGMCESCHVDAKEAKTPKLKDGGLALCADCHDQFAAMQKSPRAHDPVRQGECFACHSPHAASRPHLVKGEVAALCGECHDASDEEAAAKHRKVNADADCIACHRPHEPLPAVRRGSVKPQAPTKAIPAAEKKGAKRSRAR